MADLRLSGIERRYGSVPVLHGIDLAVADGEFVVIVGPSGCGKSTLLRIIAGLETMNGGRVEIAGADVSQRSPAQRGIAMVFQTYALYPHKTVFDNMGYGLKLAGRPRAEIRDKVSAVARVLELEPYLQRKPSALSGGQRQRVAIGRAIVRDPKVFLFDEPLSNLDAALRGQMRVEIADLHARLAATMIYVTHDQVEAMTMADRIVILNEGRIEQQGAPLELYHNPVNLFVASFLGAPRMNLLTATVTAVAVDCVTLELAGGDRIELAVEAGGLKVGDAATLGLRPHDLATSPGVHGLAVEVSLVEPLGGQTIVYGSAAGARVTVALPGDAAIQPRTSVRFSFDAADCHLFNADGVACRRLAAPHPAPQPV